MSNLIFIAIFTLFLACSSSRKASPTPLDVSIAGLVSKLPADNFVEGNRINATLIQRGKTGISEICKMLMPPGVGDDTHARYALSELGKYVSRPKAEPERLEYVQAIIAALESSSHPEITAFLIRQLGLVGKVESVEPLSRFLTDDRLCEPAMQSLLAIRAPQTDVVLLAALTEINNRNHLTLINTLGELRSQAAVERLLAFSEANHSAIRLAALRALANTGDPTAAGALENAVKTTSQAEFPQILSDYLLFAKRRAESGDIEHCTEICRSLIQNSSDTVPQVQSAALGTLMDVLGVAAMNDLLRAMDSENKQFRSAALQFAVDIPGETATRKWIEKVNSVLPEAQAEIIEMLGNRGDQSVLPDVLLVLPNPNKNIQLTAVITAAKLGGDKAIVPILKMLQTIEDRDVIETVQATLLRFSSENMLPAIASALPEVTPLAKVALLEILAERQGFSHKKTVYSFAASETRRVRSAAIKTYGKLANGDDLQHCIDLLKNAQSDAERSAAQRAIVSVARKTSDQNQIEKMLVAAVDSSDRENREYLLRAMGRIGGQAFLQKALDDSRSENPVIQEIAIKALSEWNDPAAATELLHIAQHNSERKNRILALRGYVRLAGQDSTLSPEAAIDRYRKALEFAENTTEKQMIFAGIATLDSPLALDLISEYLSDPELKAEAEAAIKKINSDGEMDALADSGKASASESASDVLANGNITAAEKGHIALFNGKDLSGWQLVAAREGSWQAVDGILYVEGDGGGWLSTTEEFADFKLELEFRVPPGGNSGVFLRAPHRGDPAYTGMEIQVLDDYAEKYANLKPWQYTGSIYAVQPPAKRATKSAGNWQKMMIICDGPRVQVTLNGKNIIDTNLIDHMHKTARNPGLKRHSGYIGFQNHGARVEYRNIKLTEL